MGLEDLGLTADEAAVYQALIALPSSARRELAPRPGWARSERATPCTPW